eukprot:TRINITY_DN832_c0_g1_i1.p1 TRINITY_DN832_c0_g1~~TRINITY_DN832_c0_g1_i1.p1  ORF type:complete len:407 (-),score=79.28 TRINITY_DN832_c0_g1_i1:17-1237(-)
MFLRVILGFTLFLAVVYCADNGLGITPPMGWNTWCTLGACGRDYCDETEVKSIADTIATNGMKELGYTYVNLDDCWADTRDSQGNIQPDPQRFPSGMKALADYIHTKGLKFGLYTCAGTYTCSSGGRDHRIPGSYGHYDQDAKTYASWGIDYVKMDWCNTQGLEPQVQYPQMWKAINATGRPIFFEMCEWGINDPWKWGPPVSNAWRATGDHHDNWVSTASVIEQMVGLSSYAGEGHWNYMDFLMTGGQGCTKNETQHCPGQTDTEYRTEFSLWTICNSGLIVSTDIRNLTPIMKDILFNSEVIAVNQDSLKKAGDRISSVECGERANTCQVWGKEVSDGYAAVLYNAGENSHPITANFSLWGWNGVTASVRDLWAKKDLGSFTGSFTTTVESHGVVFIKLKKSSN